nr:PREDICTED: uncharacterized protein LOC106489125 [Apteryx mantelli mantelli]
MSNDRAGTGRARVRAAFQPDGRQRKGEWGFGPRIGAPQMPLVCRGGADPAVAGAGSEALKPPYSARAAVVQSRRLRLASGFSPRACLPPRGSEGGGGSSRVLRSGYVRGKLGGAPAKGSGPGRAKRLPPLAPRPSSQMRGSNKLRQLNMKTPTRSQRPLLLSPACQLAWDPPGDHSQGPRPSPPRPSAGSFLTPPLLAPSRQRPACPIPSEASLETLGLLGTGPAEKALRLLLAGAYVPASCKRIPTEREMLKKARSASSLSATYSRHVRRQGWNGVPGRNRIDAVDNTKWHHNACKNMQDERLSQAVHPEGSSRVLRSGYVRGKLGGAPAKGSGPGRAKRLPPLAPRPSSQMRGSNKLRQLNMKTPTRSQRPLLLSPACQLAWDPPGDHSQGPRPSPPRPSAGSFLTPPLLAPSRQRPACPIPSEASLETLGLLGTGPAEKALRLLLAGAYVPASCKRIPTEREMLKKARSASSLSATYSRHVRRQGWNGVPGRNRIDAVDNTKWHHNACKNMQDERLSQAVHPEGGPWGTGAPRPAPSALTPLVCVPPLQSRDRKVLGDYSGALSYGSTAKCLNITTLLLSILTVVLIVILLATGVITAVSWYHQEQTGASCQESALVSKLPETLPTKHGRYSLQNPWRCRPGESFIPEFLLFFP